MKTLHLRLLSLVAGIAIFDFLFYRQAPGLNALVFVPALILLLSISGSNVIPGLKARIALAGWALSAIGVALYCSALSVLTYIGSLMIFTGFILHPGIKSVFFSGLHSFLNFFTAPFTLAGQLSDILKLRKRLPGFRKTVLVLIIPLILLFIFATLYRNASPLFNQLFLGLDESLKSFMDWLAQYLSPAHLVFLVFAGLVITGILYNSRLSILAGFESGFTDQLTRHRRQRKWKPLVTIHMQSLKDEYKMGMLLLVMLNLLLLVVNITEGIEIARDLQNASAPALSKTLHDGTALLIFSILLSILVMMALFRRNLNFYPGNRPLILASLAWIAQNLLLGVHVLLRNSFYISQYGLTYKRIGIFFFLLLVLAGLVLVSRKILQKKSLWYLLKANAWSFYVLLLLLQLMPWDTLIIRYNLRESAKQVDGSYLLDLPQRNLWQLMQQRERLKQADPAWDAAMDARLQEKADSFMAVHAEKEWPSFNYFEYRSFKYLRHTQVNGTGE